MAKVSVMPERQQDIWFNEEPPSESARSLLRPHWVQLIERIGPNQALSLTDKLYEVHIISHSEMEMVQNCSCSTYGGDMAPRRLLSLLERRTRDDIKYFARLLQETEGLSDIGRSIMALPQEQFSSTKDTELVSQGSRTAEVKHDSKSHAIAEGCQNVSQGNGNTHIYIGNLTINPATPHSGSESGIYLDDSDTSSQTPGATSDPPATFGLAEREEDPYNRSKVDIRQFLSEILPELQRRPGLHRNENCTCKVTPEHGCCGTKVRLRITCSLLLNKGDYIIKFWWKRNKHWQELIKEGRVIPEDNVFLCDVAIPPGEAGHCHFCLQLNPSGSSDKTHNWVDFAFTREEYLLKAGKPFNTRTDRYDDDDDNDDRKGPGPGPGPNRSRKDHPNDMYGKQSKSNGKSSCSTDKESKSGASDSSVDEQETHHYRSEDMQQYLFSEYLAYRLLKIDDAAKVGESEVDQLESARCRVSSLYGLPKCPPVLRSHFAAYLEPLTVEDFREHSHWLQDYSSRNDGLVTETAITSSDSDWSDEFEEAIRIEEETDESNDDDGKESKSHQKLKQMLSREYQNAVPKNAHQENKFEPAQTSQFITCNRLSHLCDGIGQLVKLKRIYLDNNKLECLPKEFCNLPSDATVLFNNPLSVPHLSVCESGMSSIKSYFQFLEGSIAVNRTRRTKLIIFGKSQSGKSSLIRAIQLLLEGRVQDACVQEQDRTIGIDQHVVSLSDVNLVVLDSGGQRSYSPINQLFTSNSCLVTITADAQQYTVKAAGAFKHLIQPYFQRVYDYVNTAVILPVVTKADLVPSKQFEQISTDLVHKGMEFQKERQKLMETYRQQNPGISTERQNITFISERLKGDDDDDDEDDDEDEYETEEQHKIWISSIICTSAKVSLGVSDLIGYMNKLLQDRSLFPGLDMLLPSSWVESEDHLHSLAKVHSPPISTLTATCQAVITFGVSPHSVQGLLSYLHTVGSICHYDRHASLRQHIFLQPQFLIDLLKAVYHHQLKSVLTVDSIALPARDLVTEHELEDMLTYLCDNGVASIKFLELIWSKFGFIAEHTNLMTKLLIAFHFAYVRCDNEHVIQRVHALVEGQLSDECDDLLGLLKDHNGELLLPWFFHDKKPEGLLMLSPPDHGVSVCLTYSFSGSLPEGLFPRLSAGCHRHSNSTQHWLNGVHMKYAGILSVIECDEARAEIVLSASTEDSLNAYLRLWMIVWRLIVDIENEIKQAPGSIPLVQRYISASLKGIQSSLRVGDQQTQITLSGAYPAFQMLWDFLSRENNISLTINCNLPHIYGPIPKL